MRTEIYIEDQRLDLYKDISAEFTYNIDDIKDFSARNTNFSKTILIPGNATNNKLFGHVFEFGSANFYNSASDNVGYNFNPAKSAACLVYVDKIQLFKGVIRLLEIVIDNGSIEYECAVFGELGGFVSALGIKKLEQLDFSAYDHVWNRDNIVNSWEQASGTTASGMGYYYPLIDYGQESTDKNDYDVTAFRPALFVREYMKKIIEGAGYTWESSFFDSAIFKRLIIPNNQRSFSQLKPYNLDVNTTGYSFTEADGTSKLVSFAIETIRQGYTVNAGNTTFTYTGAGFSGTISLNVTGTWFKNSATPFVLQILKNGSAVTNITWESQTSATPQVFNIDTSFLISLATNDTLSIQFTQTTASDFAISIGAGSFVLRVAPPQPVPVDFNYGDTIPINYTSIPKGVFQKDFFASIVKMFNLYVTESTDKAKHLIITPYIDYYTGTAHFLQVNDLEEELKIDDNFLLLLDDANADYLDWNKKIDRSKPFRIKPMSELNGRYFEYKYKTDADFYNENYFKKYAQGYGDYIEDTGYEFAQDKQTAEIIFASTPLVGYTGEDKVVSTIFKKSNTQHTESEDPIDSVIRILQVRKITGVGSWHIKQVGGGNIGSSLTSYGYAGHLDDPDVPTADINFGAPKETYFTLVTQYPSANLFNAFWSDYIAEITDKDSKLLSCYVHLTDADIYSLDFAKLIWIDGALWRLNKVEDYNPMTNETTKCEFLKVIELTYA